MRVCVKKEPYYLSSKIFLSENFGGFIELFFWGYVLLYRLERKVSQMLQSFLRTVFIRLALRNMGWVQLSRPSLAGARHGWRVLEQRRSSCRERVQSLQGSIYSVSRKLYPPHVSDFISKLLLAFTLYLVSTYALASPPEWTDKELRILHSLSLTALPPAPPSPSNRVADNPQAADFGKRVFFDTRFSGNKKISCASCHQPERYFTDQIKVGVGLGQTSRNTPTIVASAWLRWLYWDGRRDSLWSQALVPFEAAKEMGSSRTRVLWEVGNDKNYLHAYEQLFGKLPIELYNSKNIVDATPIGNAQLQDNWYRISADRRNKTNNAFANIGKAIAAYERTLLPKKTRFDKYVEQLFGIQNYGIKLSNQEKQGIKLFIDAEKTQCLQCHNGALLTNGGFHNIGTGNFQGDNLDFGRVLGIRAVLMDEFNCLGPYSDAKKEDCHQLRFLDPTQHHIPLSGAFKTPSLRNLKLTAPYLHDGRFNTLEEVLNHYTQPPQGDHELKEMPLTGNELDAMLAFLMMLDE